MWALVVCAPSRCSLDARFWNGTTSFHCVEERTVDLPGVCIGRRCESSLRLPFSNLDTSMSATSSGHAQFGSNVFFFVVAAPGRMAGTTLTTYIGLTAAAADRLFQQNLPVQPSYKQRWGLKPTVAEAV